MLSVLSRFQTDGPFLVMLLMEQQKQKTSRDKEGDNVYIGKNNIGAHLEAAPSFSPCFCMH